MKYRLLVTAAALLALPPFAFSAPRAPAPVRSMPPAPDLHVPMATTADTIVFEHLRWGTPRHDVDAKLEPKGFSRAGVRVKDEFRGTLDERPVRVACEYDVHSRLIAVTVRFESVALGEAIELYDRIVTERRGKWGEPSARIELGRSGQRATWGIYSRVLPAGPPTAATLWIAGNEDAAAVQLDGRHRVWMRLEAHDWPAAKARLDKQNGLR